MSKVVFFNESLPSDTEMLAQVSYDLIRAMRSNQHEITVFSSFRGVETLETSSPFEMEFPIRRWQLWELPFVLHKLNRVRPNLVHIIQPHREEYKNWFHFLKVLPASKSVLNNVPFILSIYDLDSPVFELKKFSSLINLVDLILVPNRAMQNEVTSQLDSHQSHHVEIIPPSFGSLNFNPEKMEDSWLSELDRPYFLIAGTVNHHLPRAEDLMQAFSQAHSKDPSFRYVFYEGWGEIALHERKALQEMISKLGLSDAVIVASELTAHQKNKLEEGTEGMIALGLSNRSLSLSQHLYASIVRKIPIFISRSQAELDNAHWSKMPHCILVDDIAGELPGGLARWSSDPSFRSKILQPLESIAQPTFDAPANQVSRLYSNLL